MTKLPSFSIMVSAAERERRADGSVDFLLRRLQAGFPDLYDHAIRSSYVVRRIAQEYGEAAEKEAVLYRTALLQDVGMLAVSMAGFSPVHAAFLRHPALGAQLLASQLRSGRLDRDALLQHHENLDGTGYPLGLKGNKLSHSGKLLRVANAFAMMTGVDARTRRIFGAELAIMEMFRRCGALFEADLLFALSEVVGQEEEGLFEQRNAAD
ncbi:MAG: HD domain-containing protein [Paenibacillaceae bacterium]|nr:HD domain-containing protein [Paenibacillaceae bacterium]